MNVDSLTLAAVASELKNTILGGKVEKVSQPDALTVVINIYHAGKKRELMMSAQNVSARVGLITSRTRPNPINPPAFCMLLRKYLEGASIEDVVHPAGMAERIIRLTFRLNRETRCFLYAEIMGKHSNLILASQDGTVLGAAKHVTPEMSRFREVRAGLMYQLPPRQKGARRNPYDASAASGLPAATFQSDAEAADWLQTTFSGMSPLMSAEAVAWSAHVPGTGEIASEAAWYGLNDLINCVRLDEYSPVLVLDGERPCGAYPVELKTVPNERQRRLPSISAALEQVFNYEEARSRFERDRDALLSALRRRRKSVDREIIDSQEGLANSDRAEEYKENAELLLANLDGIEQGASHATVPDLFSTENTESPRTIPLDSTLSVQQNAARFFKKYQKARDSKAQLEERRVRLLETQAALTAALIRAESAQSAVDVDQIAAQCANLVSTSKGASNGAGGPDSNVSQYAGYKIKSLYSADGWQILVGENATSNDYLTTKVASPTDIWLHARAVTSAHAIIRARNKPASVSTEAIRFAAQQVARRSGAKHARFIPVDFTLKKHVRKPRGSAPGQVTYSHEKTVDVSGVVD